MFQDCDEYSSLQSNESNEVQVRVNRIGEYLTLQKKEEIRSALQDINPAESLSEEKLLCQFITLKTYINQNQNCITFFLRLSVCVFRL